MANTLLNKVIIVTGGSGLIGKAIVHDINSRGGIAINADISIDTDLNNGLLYCDITEDASIQNAINTVINQFDRIDGLVNNAYPRTKDWGVKFEDIPGESLRKNVDMQLNSTVIFCQKVVEVMKKKQSGSIVNIGSTYGSVGPDFTVYEGTDMTSPAAYNAIKGGVINFTRYLASYVGKYGIRVNTVSPGGIFDHQPEPFVKNYEYKVPLKRMGKPKDIAPAISFLLSDESGYITGHNLKVDGGWTCI